MKYPVATLTPLPSASEINIRAAANKMLGTNSSDPVEVPDMVHVLLRESSAEDLNIISKSINVYNSGYSTNSDSSTASETKKTAVSVPDKLDFTLSFSSGCRWCPNSRGRCQH